LEELSASRPRLLLAHAYVRYLGDLHGGQLLRRCVARVLQAEAVHAETAPGLAFYDFGSPARVAELISSLRAGLNAATVDDAEADALAQEARLGFAWHIDLFQELDAASDV
jgi:heme oxygenase